MPPLETSDRRQKAVLWAATGFDTHGDVIVGPPVQLSVRWLESTREAITAEETTVVASATAIVDRDIALHSIMRLGKLSEVPDPPDQLMEVIDFTKTPDLKGRHYRRVVTLARYERALNVQS